MLDQKFYDQPTLKLAKALLGKYLIHKTKNITYIGRIIETEAYLKNDPASHAYKGKSKRNSAMFSKPGTSYVYLIYGMYNCFNVVSGNEGVGEAVLIRAVEPIWGLDEMKVNRSTENITNLCNGPGKLCQAMKINRKLNEISLISENFFIEERRKYKIKIVKTTRIGINAGKELLYRFYIEGSEFVSKK